MTGGASGIGAETCRVLADAGWDPIAADMARTDDVVAIDVADEAPGTGFWTVPARWPGW